MNPSPSSGHRRAALRVKQKRRKDERTWSPSGKLLKGKQRPQSKINQKPWNNRKWSVDGKENNAKEKSPARSRPEMKHYTERCDGVAVLEFTRCEISPTSPIVVKNDECHDLIGTRSVSTSPFDMDKVRAALHADVIDTQNEHDEELTTRNNDKGTRSNDPLTNPLFLQPLDRDRIKSILDNFEDLLYTIELEEELLKRDIATRKQIAQPIIRDPDGEEKEGIPHFQIDQNNTCQTTRTEPRISISPERCIQILEYVNRSKHVQNKQHKLIAKNGDMKYHEIAEALADSLVESCIDDIAQELHKCMEHISEDVFQQL